MYSNQNIEAIWKLAEFAEALKNEDFICQINKEYSEDERFILAFFSNVRKFLKAKAQIRKFLK